MYHIVLIIMPINYTVHYNFLLVNFIEMCKGDKAWAPGCQCRVGFHDVFETIQ